MDLTAAAAVVLAATMAWAGLSKLLFPGRWRGNVEGYALPAWLSRIAVVSVPVAEIAVAIALVAGAYRIGGGVGALMLAAFSVALLRLRARTGDRLPCGCFGGRETRDYRVLLARNVLLFSIALYVTAQPSMPPLSADSVPPALLLTIGGIALMAWAASAAWSGLRK